MLLNSELLVCFAEQDENRQDVRPERREVSDRSMLSANDQYFFVERPVADFESTVRIPPGFLSC